MVGSFRLKSNAIKTFVTTLCLITMFLGCFNDKGNVSEKGKLNIVSGKNSVAVAASQDILGTDVTLNGIIDSEMVKTSNDLLKIVKVLDGKTEVVIASKNGVITKGTELFSIDGNLNVTEIKTIGAEDKSYLSKRATGVDTLLGDFDANGTVGITDFIEFAQYYGSVTDVKHDIAPAVKGTGVWADIYSQATPDKKVGIDDFIVFAGNYNKVAPVKTVVSIAIAVPLSAIEKGKTITLEARVRYSDGTEAVESVNWSSSAPAVASIDTNGKVTAVSKGTATLTAEKSGVKGTASITVSEPVQTGITIYFEKPDTWSTACIWYNGNSAQTIWDTTANPPSADVNAKMETATTGWLKKVLTTATAVEFLFNDGTWNNKLCAEGFNKASTAANFKTTKNMWVFKDGTTTLIDPIKAVAVNATPGSQSIVEASLEITLNVKGATGKYSYGTDNVMNGTSYVDGTKIIIALPNIGDTKVLNLYATNGTVEDSATFTYKRVEKPVSKKPGAVYTVANTTFSIWSPDTANVKVTVDGKDYDCVKVADFDGYTNIYSVTVQGDLKLKEYQFKINGVGVRDPYGVMINNTSGNNVVMDLSATEPDGGWSSRPTLNEREDSVIYEIHVRDFSIDASSGVDAAKRGKYPGMVQKGTVYAGKATTIDHLKELGVTHVQILPMYDFATGSDSKYNWGYDPRNYNIPEEWYSTTSDPIGRIKEVKTMINELHKNGIRVIMDVVYNHTYSDEMFKNITNQYYYTDVRRNMAGCGIAVNCTVPMVSRFIQDSLNYWVSEYKIDGFRFDLIGIFTVEEVNKWGKSLNANNPGANLLIYGEPWDGYYDNGDARNTDSERGRRVRLGKAPELADAHVGLFNNSFREGIKGNNDGTKKAYMFNVSPDNADSIRAGLRGSIMDYKSTSALSDAWYYKFAYDPEQTINYISAHDNYCLWDKIQVSLADSVTTDASGNATAINLPASKLPYGKRVDKFGMGIIFTAQGVPFIHGGDEILRTKTSNGDWTDTHNSYNAPDSKNSMKWNWKLDNAETFAYYSGMINMRKAHPGFRMTTWDEVNNNVKVTQVSSQILVNEINGAAKGDTWKKIIVVYNSGADYTYTLPSGTWKIAASGENAAVGGVPATGTVKCEGTAVTVLYQE